MNYIILKISVNDSKEFSKIHINDHYNTFNLKQQKIKEDGITIFQILKKDMADVKFSFFSNTDKQAKQL